MRRYLFQGYRPIIVLTLIFCSSNFTILYLLSSSPHLVTIELSIYQSIIFNADLYSGMALGIIQLILMLFLSSLILFNQNYDQSFLINKSSINCAIFSELSEFSSWTTKVPTFPVSNSLASSKYSQFI